MLRTAAVSPAIEEVAGEIGHMIVHLMARSAAAAITAASRRWLAAPAIKHNIARP